MYWEYRTTDLPGYRNYQDYLDAIKGGFEDKDLFYKAKQYNIPNYEIYKDFTEKGFKDMLRKVTEIEVDAGKKYKNHQYEQVVQLRYLAAEKFIKILYFKLFNNHTWNYIVKNLWN